MAMLMGDIAPTSGAVDGEQEFVGDGKRGMCMQVDPAGLGLLRVGCAPGPLRPSLLLTFCVACCLLLSD